MTVKHESLGKPVMMNSVNYHFIWNNTCVFPLRKNPLKMTEQCMYEKNYPQNPKGTNNSKDDLFTGRYCRSIGGNGAHLGTRKIPQPCS